VFRWLPRIAALSLRRQPREDLLPVETAAVVLIGVIVLLMVIGLRQVDRDDVTA
jgi:hypothetical protein